MTENPKEALDALLNSLRSIDAKGIADEITAVVARGITAEVELNGKVKELSQRPLNSDQAYKVAVEMLVASLEPAIMKEHALREIKKITDQESSIIWLQDFVEESPISPQNYQDISIPDFGSLDNLEIDLKKLVILIDNI